MVVTINKENKNVSDPVEMKTEQITENLTKEEKIKKVKDRLEQMYGSVAMFKLPNDKIVFVRAATYDEYEIIASKIENAQKGIGGGSIREAQKHMVQLCTIDVGTNDVGIGSFNDLKQYPVTIYKLASKIESMSGGDVDEYFLQ